MSNDEATKVVQTLLEKAAGCMAIEAVQYTQAALNAANAFAVLETTKANS